MAKYQDVTTTGTIEWARIFENNRDMNGYEGSYVECEGAYTLNQILSKDEFTKLQATGSQKKPNQKRLMEGQLTGVKILEHIKHEEKAEEMGW